MPRKVNNQIYRCSVFVDPEGHISYDCDNPKDDMWEDEKYGPMITTHNGRNMIVLELQNRDGDPTPPHFATQPIQWVTEPDSIQSTLQAPLLTEEGAEYECIDTPPGFRVIRESDHRCVILDDNFAAHRNRYYYKFLVVVMLNGKIFGEHPTILNQPYGGPGEDG